MKTKVELPHVKTYAAEGVTLQHQRIGHRQLRVVPDVLLTADQMEEIRKAVCRIKGVVRAKVTGGTALLLTMQTRPARLSFEELSNAALQLIAHKAKICRRRNPVRNTQSKDKQRFVNKKTKPALVTT